MFQGFIRKVSGCFRAQGVVLLVVLLLAGCKLYPAPESARPSFSPMQAAGGSSGVMLPYKFYITAFIDARPEEETASYTGEVGQDDAFPQQVFTSALQGHLGYSLYGTKNGTLAVTLTHYQLTEYKRDFSLSLQVRLVAKTDLGRTLVDEDFTCAQDKYRSPRDIPRMVKDSWKTQSGAPFTQQGWHDEILQQLVQTCAQNVAQRFAQSALNSAMNSQSAGQ